MKNKYILVGAIALVVVLLVVLRVENSRGGGVDLGGRHSGSVSSTVAGSSEQDQEEYAPDFKLSTLSGESISLSQFRGEKPVVLDFFATWCPNCRRDMPKLSAWYEQYKGEVEVIGVNLQERESTVAKFVESKGISFPIVLDPQSQVARDYGVQFTNYHVLIDRQGRLAGVVPGDISEADILALIR